ncbi:hypothetical protein AKJ09_01507 [Labilithrix luteola]|uniref:IgGFc-binding protein N-terminal domain-containing protein n=1 Tax=Labilithrix luteola TaxID=1391654 RepID=A0A0K1PMT8_9BACT|nr:IgGFc-binding protein [Labilithrix luteola]AKU94843.1 hypothetical protein AKJ09_01507 [Labilithrix luteola]
MQILTFFGIAFLASGVAASVVACSSSNTGFSDPVTPPLVDNDAGDGSSAATVCQETQSCSRDLKRIVTHHCDGSDTASDACPPDQGCGTTSCVAACDSAKLSKGSIGCEFATLPPDQTSGAQGSCFVAMVANVWDKEATLSASYGGEPLDISASTYYADMQGTKVVYTPVTGPVSPGKVALVFLSGNDAPNTYDFIGCPSGIVPALRKDPIAHKTARTKAFQISSDIPVSAYSIWPYGGAVTHTPTATMLLPISSWDTNYVAVSTWATSNPTVQIIGAEDGTEVRMRPNVDILGGGGITGIGEGQTQTWTINKGEVLQITQKADTSGSPIQANKPIGLFGGSECTFMVTSACDVTQQQIAPVSQWGSEYALVPYRPRTGAGAVGMTSARETVPWRLVGAVNGTKLTYDPAPFGGAPETLEAGQVVTFVANDLMSVRSQDDQHPFYAGMFMTGGLGIANSTNGPAMGDPDFVNAVPSAQFLDRYIFFVDHTYPETTLTFVRKKTDSGFKPVTLECAGEISDWKPLDVAGDYEFTWVYLTNRGMPQKFPGGTCGYGRHEANSDGPFAVYVWGTDVYSSYGYAGGTGSRPLSATKGPPVN